MMPKDYHSEPSMSPLIVPPAEINVDDATLLLNLSINIRRGLPQVLTSKELKDPIIVAGGGWSLKSHFDKLQSLYWQGRKVVAMNGSARWLIERGVKPTAVIHADARLRNACFFADLNIPDCDYYIASHCAPEIFDLLQGRDIYLYHSIGSEAGTAILDEYYNKNWVLSHGGPTVGLNALVLARQLGYPYQHLFGFDSCLSSEGVNHPYPQAIDEEANNLEVVLNDKTFRCEGWHLKQANNFHKLMHEHGRHFSLRIYGDGLLAHVMMSGTEPRVVSDA